MPYNSVGSLPPAVRRKIKSPKKRRQWMHVWNSEYAAHGDESRAFASAWSTVQKREAMKKSATSGDAAGNFSFFLPIAKIDKQRRTISGYASTPALDLDGEVVSLDAVKKALPGYWEWRNIREMHGPSAVGVAKEANVDDKGLFLSAKIVDDDAWQKCVEGVYKGFSVGGKKLAKKGNIITDIDLVEISVVDRPANPECKFDVHKAAGVGSAYLVPAKPIRTPQQRAMKKMADAVGLMSKADTITSDFNGKPGVDKPPVGKCEKHGLAECAKCAAKAAKKLKKRKASAKVKAKAFGNRGKVKNLIPKAAEEFGVKVPKGATKKQAKAIIKKALSDRAADLVAKYSRPIPEIGSHDGLPARPTEPSFLVLGVGQDPGAGRGSSRPGQEDFLKLGQVQLGEDGNRRLKKGMGAAGSMSYCFDSLRDVQRRLMSEAKREGGDKKDAALAKQVGMICKELAAVIGQKAEHEGAEALNLSDADDQWLKPSLGEDMTMSVKSGKKNKTAATMNLANIDELTKMMIGAALWKAGAGGEPSRIQRVEMARGEMKKTASGLDVAKGAIKAAHEMHKSAYLAKQANAALVKAGKKKPAADDDEEFDHQDAMEKLQKAYGALEKIDVFVKSARNQLKKVAKRADQGGGTNVNDASEWFTPIPNVKLPSPEEMATQSPGGSGSGSMPPAYPGDGSVYPGKMARKLAKLASTGRLSAEVAEALAEAVHLEGQNEALSKMPAGALHGGRRPVAFDLSKVSGMWGDNVPDAEAKQTSAILFKNVNPASLASDDEGVRKGAVNQVISNMILGGAGKSLFDPKFNGSAGVGGAVTHS